jgi:glycerol transport system ATP-binding protein
MQLELEEIEQRVGSDVHLYRQSLKLTPGVINVLLGATKAGKTSLMRIMAGLDQPSHGRVLVDGRDVTNMPVRERNVAMVYQQFINYPAMTVAENIGSPLRLRGEPPARIQAKVRELAERLHIEMFLERLPAELSGGQQQRVALARALAKDAPLILFDEPLVNLDYKLREELREELTLLFASSGSTVVYATTEPGEALMLGGYTAVMDAGELLQYGPAADVFHRPSSLRVARAFSDPPMNLIEVTQSSEGLRFSSGVTVDWELAEGLPESMLLGVRANAVALQPTPRSTALDAHVELAEISGSNSFLHVKTPVGDLVAQLAGVHNVEIGSAIQVHIDLAQAYLFDSAGPLLQMPTALKGGR